MPLLLIVSLASLVLNHLTAFFAQNENERIFDAAIKSKSGLGFIVRADGNSPSVRAVFSVSEVFWKVAWCHKHKTHTLKHQHPLSTKIRLSWTSVSPFCHRSVHPQNGDRGQATQKGSAFVFCFSIKLHFTTKDFPNTCKQHRCITIIYINMSWRENPNYGNICHTLGYHSVC